MRNAIVLLILILISFNTHAQKSGVIGVVSDNETGESLISATIKVEDIGATTDFDGSFKLELSPGPHRIVFSYVGYQDQLIDIVLAENEMKDLSVLLRPTNTLLETATISGSKYERRLAESPVSISVINSDLIQSVNTIEVNTLLDKIPGVQLIEDSANIRGGSGFSFGAGSRVMLLVDDVPTMQPDAGRPNWSDIPVENISQIEVLKGASSVMYGSAALNGIINVRTGYAVTEPVTKFNISYQHIMSPKDERKQWWDSGFGNAPSRITAGFLHKQKFRKLDLVTHGYFDDYDHFYKDSFKKKLRGSVNLRYRLSDRVVIGINSLLNKGHTAIPFLRKDAVRGAYLPLPGNLSESKNTRFYIDPHINIYDRKKNHHKLLMRYYYINNNNNNNQSNQSTNYYADYQHVRNLDLLDATLSGGLTAFHLISDSELFGDSKFTAGNFAGYAQIEKKIFEKINVSAGFRYEINNHKGPEVFMGDTIPGGKIDEGKLIKRFSINGEVAEATFVRASYGEGYRFPTIVERFIFTNFANFTIFPNVSIGSEFGWSTEIGIKQGFSFGAFKGYLDYSTFWSRYEDMLEFTFASMDGQLGFQTQNIGNVDIKGHEINVTGLIDFGEISMNLLTGYTYINPTYQDYETNEQIANSIAPQVNVLKYRTKHNFKIDLETFYKKLSLGFAFNRTSHMITIDKQFELVANIKEYREFDNNGYYKADARIGYDFDILKMSVIVNNMLNEEYEVRPGFFDEPRSIALRLDFKL